MRPSEGPRRVRGKTRHVDIHLTPEQAAEIERRLSDDEPYATDEEVRATFDRVMV
jgi:hypothetical protein